MKSTDFLVRKNYSEEEKIRVTNKTPSSAQNSILYRTTTTNKKKKLLVSESKCVSALC